MQNRSMKMLGASAALVLGLTACSGGGAGSDGGDGGGDADAAPEDMTVGVAMPTQTYERWLNDGASVEEGLEELGYTADLQFADDDIPTQQQQIDQMITQEYDALIIASIDGSALTSQLDAAAAADIPVISYDRLLTNSENVDFYVTFDNFAVGQEQANALLYGLGVFDENFEEAEDAPEETLNVELFAGSLDDNNARFFWDGAMDVLEPYIEDGTLAVPSGQTTIDQAATQRWEQETAQERMENLLTSDYRGEEELHGVLSRQIRSPAASSTLCAAPAWVMTSKAVCRS